MPITVACPKRELRFDVELPSELPPGKIPFVSCPHCRERHRLDACDEALVRLDRREEKLRLRQLRDEAALRAAEAAQAVFNAPPPPVAKPQPEFFQCPHCRYLCETARDRCPECGIQFTGSDSVQPTPAMAGSWQRSTGRRLFGGMEWISRWQRSGTISYRPRRFFWIAVGLTTVLSMLLAGLGVVARMGSLGIWSFAAAFLLFAVVILSLVIWAAVFLSPAHDAAAKPASQDPWRAPRVVVLTAAAIAFVFTWGVEPGVWSLIRSLSLAVWVGAGVARILRWTRLPTNPRRAIAAVFAVVVPIAFRGLDTYEFRWTSATGANAVDTVLRWGDRHIYREVWTSGTTGSSQGPMIRDGVQHGHWTHTGFSPYYSLDLWYWYGQEVSEGEWHRLNR